MIIKNFDTDKTSLSYFDLLGNNETALAKAFSYLIGKERECLSELLKFLNIYKNTSITDYRQIKIEIEKHRDQGRTDIEISKENDFHIIIECKINSGKITKQRTQYLTAFDSKVSKTKVLVFLTQEKDTQKIIPANVLVKSFSWLEIIELYNDRKFIQKETVASFLRFATKNYKMKHIKEILIQDLKDPIEIERFKEFGVYRRNPTFGSPLYFAPYYTRGATNIEGIICLSKVLGILTIRPGEIETYQDDLMEYCSDPTIVSNWISGINHGNDNPNVLLTYYLLDQPLTFKTPLRKDQGNKKGTGKGWISKYIPVNRTISFIEFLKHVPELS